MSAGKRLVSVLKYYQVVFVRIAGIGTSTTELGAIMRKNAIATARAESTRKRSQRKVAKAKSAGGASPSRTDDAALAALRERMHRELDRLTDGLQLERITEALAERTDASALARVLSDVVADDDAVRRLDPTAVALFRGADVKRRLLEDAGGTFGTAELTRLLGITQQAIDKRVRRGSLLAVRTPSGELRFPVIQFTEDGTIDGLEKVLAAFAVASPWTRLSVLLSRDPAVGNHRIIDALRNGDIDGSLDAVRSYGA
jgi:hypothetical protein